MSTFGRARAGLGKAVLGADSKLRRNVARCLMILGICVITMLAIRLNQALGLGDPFEVKWLACFIIGFPLVFYALIRSGWSQRLARPGMVVPQAIFAVVAIVVSYPVSGPLRGLHLITAAMPMFALTTATRRETVAFLAFTLLAFGTVMLALALTQPTRFDPRVEATHFGLALVCLPATALLLNQISVMRERIQQHKRDLEQALARIELISTRDELTGLVNRQHMTTLLDAELTRRARDGPRFCLCLLDIDHFKRINDTLGHAAGDEVLRRFAAIASQALRPSDVLARWGGEEFLLMFPATPLAVAAEQVQRLRDRLAVPEGWNGCPTRQVRVSAGIAADEHGSAESILERADRALYCAKANGRDRLELATPTVVT